MNFLKKINQTLYKSNKSKPKSLDKFNDSSENFEGFLKELSPFYYNENSDFDETTMDILIKLKKPEKRNN